MDNKRVALVILDGWGIAQNKKYSAVDQANTPYMDSLLKQYPHSTLLTHGENVGLPEGQMGNSEVGHLNIGAGRVVYQELQRINVAIKDNSLAANKQLNDLFDYCKNNNKPLHLMGLISDGGVHSHWKHAVAICQYAKAAGVKEILLHAFTDGRDTDPMSGKDSLAATMQALGDSAKIVSVIGRYYAMDRDKRWERVKKAYDLLVKGEGTKTNNLLEAIQISYTNEVTDEFILPIVCEKDFKPIKEEDAVLCFNFRTDRCREITQALTQTDFPDFDMKKMALYYATMTVYDSTYQNVKTIFQTEKLENTLGAVLENNKKTQLRAAETEKYPHVTFFFNGGKEQVFVGEERVLEPSPKVATYDLQPEMSAKILTEKVCSYIKINQPDFLCFNFANPDMVGHTGVFSAVVKAIETVDACLQKIVTNCIENNYTVLITADHGNADNMINEDGTPNTAHSLNPVPFIIVNAAVATQLKNGKLGDIAPTILQLMGLQKPIEMTGESLIA